MFTKNLLAASTLALGVAACTAIFSFVHPLLLTPFTYPRPAELVTIEPRDARTNIIQASLADVDAWQKETRAFSIDRRLRHRLLLPQRRYRPRANPWRAGDSQSLPDPRSLARPRPRLHADRRPHRHPDRRGVEAAFRRRLRTSSAAPSISTSHAPPRSNATPSSASCPRISGCITEASKSSSPSTENPPAISMSSAVRLPA